MKERGSYMNQPIVKFHIKNGEVPKITVDGFEFLIVTLKYIYETSTEEDCGVANLEATGYIKGSQEMKLIHLDGVTGTSFILDWSQGHG